MQPINFSISELDLILEGLVLKEEKLNLQLEDKRNFSDLFINPSILNELSVLSVIRKKVFHHLIGN
jgi:hypothetical protein